MKFNVVGSINFCQLDGVDSESPLHGTLIPNNFCSTIKINLDFL